MGRAAVFCRFSGCNLWSGRESDRQSAICNFCDTDFVGTGADGGRFTTAEELVAEIDLRWGGDDRKFIVLTGGEPMLQVDDLLIRELHHHGFEVAIETNGTLPVPRTIDWICVSPKGTSDIVVRAGNELKLVYPQQEAMPDRFASWPFDHFFLQPMDSPEKEQNIASTIEYCMTHPKWRLSMQTHKALGIR